MAKPNVGLDFSESTTTNIFSPSGGRVETPTTFLRYDRRRVGLYLQDQLVLPGGWHLLAGLRYDDMKEDYTRDGGAQPSWKKGIVTPRGGVLWRPIDAISAYYSYSQNQGQSQGFEYPGTPLKPEFTKAHEAGVKSELLGGRVSATVGAFMINKQDVASADPDPSHAGFVIGLGEVESKGYELILQGAVTDRWKLLANYTYASPVIIVGASGVGSTTLGGNAPFSGVAGRHLPGIAEHTFSAWTSHDLPVRSGLTVGGGATWQSDVNPNSWSTNPVTGEIVTAEAFWLASAFARYATKISGRNVQFQFNLENLFDTLYATRVNCQGGFGSNQCYSFYGNPRSAQLQMQVGF